MTPSSVATSAVVIVIVLVSLLAPCKGRNSVEVSHLSLTHREITTAWGTRDLSAGAHGYRGDEFFDYYYRNEPVPALIADEPPWRPVGADGQILFYVNQHEGQAHPVVAVGVCIPLGGPDQFAAMVSTATNGV